MHARMQTSHATRRACTVECMHTSMQAMKQASRQSNTCAHVHAHNLTYCHRHWCTAPSCVWYVYKLLTNHYTPSLTKARYSTVCSIVDRRDLSTCTFKKPTDNNDLENRDQCIQRILIRLSEWRTALHTTLTNMDN